MTGDEKVLERYLNAATRGLWGRRRNEAREELAAHLLERTRRLQVGGLPRAQAVEKACGRMGSAGKVALGFMEVHSMSKLLLVTTFILLGGVGSVFWTMQRAMAEETPPAPWGSTSSCTRVEFPTGSPNLRFCTLDVPGVSFDSLINQFKAAGFPAREVMVNNYSDKIYEHIEVKFPNGKTSRIPFASPGQREGPELYAGSWQLLSELEITSGQGFTLEGWETPALNIGGKRVLLESARGEAIAYNLYAQKAFDHNIHTLKGTGGQRRLVQLAHPSYPDKTLEGTEKRAISVEAADGTVLAAFSRAGNGDWVLDVAPVLNNRLEVFLARGAVKPVSNKQFTGTKEQTFFVIPIKARFKAPEKLFEVPDALEVKLLD